MRQETNNEMDLLLRRLGRRPDVLASGTEDHLDPDELNAYAENALPSAARARYTEHLAECGSCRDLVVQLNSSAGVVIAEQTARVVEPSGLKKFLASLFSPMVLRFAVPALGLIVIAVIGLRVLRQNSPTGDHVSQLKREQVQPATAESPQAKQYIDSAPQQSDSSVSNEAGKTNNQQSTATPKREEAPAVADQNTAAAKPEAQPVTAAEPPPAKPADETAVKQLKNEDASRQKEAEVKVAQGADAKKDFEIDKSEKRSDAPAMAPASVAKSKTISTDSVRAGVASPGASRAQERGLRDDKDSSPETRSVAGRTFRKRDGVWIDTAYNSSRDVTPLTRGSEYYRGLIADEPAIKTIAEQLDGEIIVVWKTRTYRIR